MNIIMRHGHAEPSTHLVNDNGAFFLKEPSIISILEKKSEILSFFGTPPTIYTSTQDRAIETALLLSPNGEELLRKGRIQIEERIQEKGLIGIGGNWYLRLGIELPSEIKIEESLYQTVSEEILNQDGLIIIAHSDAIQGLALQLHTGEYTVLPH